LSSRVAPVGKSPKTVRRSALLLIPHTK